MEFTQGDWHVGKLNSTVVSDKIPDGYVSGTGHDETEYYGGFLIAESIKHSDAILIAEAKNLLECVTRLMPHATTIINENHPDHKFVTSILNKLK